MEAKNRQTKEVAAATAPKFATHAGGLAYKKGKVPQVPLSSLKRKTSPMKAWKRTKVFTDPNFPKIWVSSTVDGKGEPILESTRAMSNPFICGKIIKAMVFLND